MDLKEVDFICILCCTEEKKRALQIKKKRALRRKKIRALQRKKKSLLQRMKKRALQRLKKMKRVSRKTQTKGEFLVVAIMVHAFTYLL